MSLKSDQLEILLSVDYYSLIHMLDQIQNTLANYLYTGICKRPLPLLITKCYTIN